MKRTLLAIAIGAISAGLAGGALAQDNADEENGLNGEAAVGEEQTTVDTHDDDGLADGPDMDDPDMDEPGEMDAGEGELDTAQGDDLDPMGADDQLDASLRDMQVSEIEGMTVVNMEDEDIGDVQSVVRDNDTGDLHVVVTVGGLWGMGGTDITLPLAEMELRDDQLVTRESYDEDQLEESGQEYDEERYSEVDGDMTLGDAWGH